MPCPKHGKIQVVSGHLVPYPRLAGPVVAAGPCASLGLCAASLPPLRWPDRVAADRCAKLKERKPAAVISSLLADRQPSAVRLGLRD